MIIALAALATADPFLRDAPIASTALQYLDGTSWSASATGNKPAGCRYSSQLPNAITAAPSGRTRTVDAVYSREECCAHCWSEALCTSSLYSSSDDSCLLLLQTTLPDTTTLTKAKTHCEPIRSTSQFSLTIPASVPGDLLTDLQTAGQISDPLREKNFLNSSIWQSHVWTYAHKFSLSPSVLRDVTSGGRVLLVFDGIKMGATIALDGVVLGTAADQFLRYTYDVTAQLQSDKAATTHELSVSFDPAIHVGGRFTACTGGWDWAPYSHTYLDGAHTFSKGIWKSVYLSSTYKASVAITHVVPQLFYKGSYPTERLVDGKHAGFKVGVRVFFSSAVKTSGKLTLRRDVGAVIHRCEPERARWRLKCHD
mgnify:CR=1 FL=1